MHVLLERHLWGTEPGHFSAGFPGPCLASGRAPHFSQAAMCPPLTSATSALDGSLGVSPEHS